MAQRTRELAALNEVSREISSRLDINHVLRSVTDKARELLNCEVAFLCLLDDESQALNLRAVSGPQEAVGGARVPAQHPLPIPVPAGDRVLPCGVDDCGNSCGIIVAPFRVSHLAAPLWVGERVIGALCVSSPEAGAFSGEARELLIKLANSAAIALENARLYEQAERVAMLEERQRIAAEIHDALAQTLVKARELVSGLILMDIVMPGFDGLEATRRIKQELPAVTVVMFTVRDEDEELFEAIKSGAQGYLLKNIRSRAMLDLLRGAMRGEVAITPALAGRVLEEFRRLSRQAASDTEEEMVALTHREQEVLSLVAEGAADKEIADALYISVHTVKSHMRNILAKLHVNSRHEAARYARRKGLV